MSDGFVEAAMVAGAVAPRDERGLMPLAGARALVQAAREFRKGGGRMVGDTWVLDSDVLWAALMSLADAAEFVREATRLCWFFHPRGQDNTAPLERYGEAILPWLASFVRPDGRLVNVPWCVKPCLLAIGRAEVFALLWGVTCVSEGTGDGWPGPFAADDPGDADRRSGVDLDAPAPAAPDEDADGLVFGWVMAHGPSALAPLAGCAAAGDARARLMLKTLADLNPLRTFGAAAAALGGVEAGALFAAIGAPTRLDERVVLWTLSTGARRPDWPELHAADPERAYHALRLIAVRQRRGEGFWIFFQRLEGIDAASLRIETYCYGTEASGSKGWQEAPFHVDHVDQEDASGAPLPAEVEQNPYDIEELTVTGPRGPLLLENAMLTALDLRPRLSTAAGAPPSRFVLMLRAYLAVHPGALWDDPRATPEILLGPDFLGDDGFDVLVVSDAFTHALGDAEAGSYDAAWRVDPAASTTYQSLARAIVARDGSLFAPGVSNLDWRLHAVSPVVDEGAAIHA
jgi:hypothetical protein